MRAELQPCIVWLRKNLYTSFFSLAVSWMKHVTCMSGFFCNHSIWWSTKQTYVVRPQGGILQSEFLICYFCIKSYDVLLFLCPTWPELRFVDTSFQFSALLHFSGVSVFSSLPRTLSALVMRDNVNVILEVSPFQKLLSTSENIASISKKSQIMSQ